MRCNSIIGTSPQMQICRTIAGLLLTVAALGCDGGVTYPATAPATGVVTYQGQPLADANVSFIPSGGRPATATTDAKGEFTLTTFREGDGAIPGDHQVVIQKFSASQTGELYAETKLAIPKKYAELKSTPLVLNVPADGDTQLRIELKD